MIYFLSIFTHVQIYVCFKNIPHTHHSFKCSQCNSGYEDVFYLAKYWQPLLTCHINLELHAVKRTQHFSSLKCYSADYTTDMLEAVWIRRLNTNPGKKDVAKTLPAPKIMGSPVIVLQLHPL